jgi:hypothetical protein
MPKLTRTAEHWAAPRAHVDGVRPISQAVIEDPTFMPRLSWKIRPPIPITDAKLPETIRGAGDAAFFCDTSVFDERLDPAIIEAMLAAPNRLVLTPFVMAESKDWLGRHPDHPLAAAIVKKEAPVLERKPPADGARGRSSYLYYLWLLLMRRGTFELHERRFEEEHGRAPNEVEREAIRLEVEKQYGPRGFMLAKKGLSKVPADESLPILAAEFALETGRIAHVVTADADVLDQFAKLLWLLDTHYRAMLLADHYASDFAKFSPRPLRLSRVFRDDQSAFPFEPGSAVLIDRGSEDLLHVLPPRPRCVAISCWHLSKDFSAMTFMAEQEMRRVLEVKDRTGGLNTDRLGDRNLHAWLAPLPVRDEDRVCAAVVRDKRVTLPGTAVRVPMHDFAQSAFSIERHTRFVPIRNGPTRIDSAAGTPVVYRDLVLP